jgi:ubiquinone/menaquinone biosynthesis C-methylase UbiE
MATTIQISGGDTAKPHNLRKRIALLTARYDGPPQPRFLDCGCGGGDYVAALAQEGWDAYGIEYLDRKIAVARQAGFTPERILQGDAQQLPHPTASFDAVMFNEVLEHVPSDEQALAEAYRVLRPGGHLFVFSPNRLYPIESHGVHWKRTQKRLPVWTPFVPYVPLSLGNRFLSYWARNYWPHQLRGMVREAGFQVVGTAYVWQTFEGISRDTSRWLCVLRPRLRALAGVLERVPLVRCLGLSQFIHARKPASGPVAGVR